MMRRYPPPLGAGGLGGVADDSALSAFDAVADPGGSGGFCGCAPWPPPAGWDADADGAGGAPPLP